MKAISSGVSLRALGYLVALSEECHFGRAAERCFVSQPTLSAQIKKLEEQLGVTLVERTQRHVMITEIGDAVVERARHVLQGVEEINELTRSHQDPLAGELAAGLIPTVGPYLLARVARPLRTAFPKLRLMLVERQTGQLIRQLEDGELDLAILALPLATDAMESEVLYEEEFVVALPADHPLSGRQRLRVQDLDGEKLLLLEEGHCLSDQALEVCSRIDVQQPQDFRATSLATLTQMVGSGIGVTLLPQLAAEKPLAGNAGLAIRPFQKPRPKRVIAAIWRKTSPRADTIRLICSVIRDAMGA